MEIKEIKRNEDGITAALSGRLDTLTAAEFTAAVDKWLADGDVKVCGIDCSGLDYISSSGLRAILMLAKKLQSSGGSLRLAGLQESVHNVFTISGFDKIIPIVDQLDEPA